MSSPEETTPAGYDPEAIAALMRERGVTETRIATVDRPDGFTVAFRDGVLVEIEGAPADENED